MTLPADITSEVAAALVAVWDLLANEEKILFPATMNFRPSHAYDPATGSNAVTWGASVTGKKVLKWDQKLTRPDTGDRRSDGQPARLTVTKLMVRTVDIGAEVPAVDSMIEVDGAQWAVSEVEAVPTGLAWILTVRK